MTGFDIVMAFIFGWVLSKDIVREFMMGKVTLAWQYVVAVVRHFPRKTQNLKQDIAHLSGLLEYAHQDIVQLRASLALAAVEYRTLQNTSSSLLNAARQESYILAQEVGKLENEKDCTQGETDWVNLKAEKTRIEETLCQYSKLLVEERGNLETLRQYSKLLVEERGNLKGEILRLTAALSLLQKAKKKSPRKFPELFNKR